ncbi:uncharacterized protein hemgn isoform X1 [Archocentrus centrarchus]|uniref:uncharacterized protein hemgn isoform X1 n=1 Tax=Archocentrus centrarchus TaxID=63155 RepID=UPI0011EA4781|nr:uncharacterized protein LOC115800605 isoform X1 [Archocentrus centrarchus]
MEDTSRQEKQDLEYKNPNEDEGGIRRRLRDRDLLRKRKAEAEEKETNQWVLGVESQRKRSRAEDKSGTKKRGRPRKTEPTPQLSVAQEEVTAPQEAPAVVVLPEPAEVIQDQITGSLPLLFAVESQPASVLAPPAPASVLEPIQNSATAPVLAFTAPVPIQDSTPAPDAVSFPALSQDSVPAATPAPPSAPSQVETLYTESQGKEAPVQVLIEDLGPDEEEDISPVQDNKGANEDLSETLSFNVPEQNNVYSVPTVSAQPMAREYFPGN